MRREKGAKIDEEREAAIMTARDRQERARDAMEGHLRTLTPNFDKASTVATAVEELLDTLLSELASEMSRCASDAADGIVSSELTKEE